jgi:type IV pilus assembly protein PilC
MVAIGEEAGTLDEMLTKVADFYEEEVDRTVDALTSLIEPMMMVFIGGIIGFIIIAMYLPIFKMGELLK